MSTVRRTALSASILAAALALTGCAAASSSAPSAPASHTPSAAPVAATSAAPAPSPSAASTAICTSHACIVSDVEKSLVGLVAKDESVITKAVCYKSTVKANPGDTYTVSCDVTYSDGTVYSGDATLLVAKGQIAWEPTGQVS